MKVSWTTAGVEPTLDEMLADPIVQLVMRRDRIAAGDVRRAVRGAAPRSTREPAAHAAGVPAEVDG